MFSSSTLESVIMELLENERSKDNRNIVFAVCENVKGTRKILIE